LNTYSSKDGPTPDPDIPPGYVWRDWNGLVSTEVLVEGLERYPDLADVVQFIGESWLRWLAMAADRPIAQRAVRVCFETELSREIVQAMLEFDCIGESPRYFFQALNGRPQWAWIVNPNKVGHYLRFNTREGAGSTIFLRIMEELGIEPLGDALDLEQQKLLNMLAFRIPY